MWRTEEMEAENTFPGKRTLRQISVEKETSGLSQL
jgi:hypothetical protein